MGTGEDDPVSLVPVLHEALREAGRSTDGFEISIYFCPPTPDTVKRCADGGISRVLFPVGSLPKPEALATLDTYAALTR